MVPQHTQEANVTPLSAPSSAGPIESSTVASQNLLDISNSSSLLIDTNSNSTINMNSPISTNNIMFPSKTLEMDTEGNQQYVIQSILFGSQRVDVNSKTPYSDATQVIKFLWNTTFCISHKMIGTYKPSQTKKHSPNHIKRPMNSFMVFSQIKRREICEKTPELHNADISKKLGVYWKNLSPDERKPYIDEAELLRQLHLKEYPNYKYRPQKKQSKSSKNPSSGESNNSSNSSPISSSSGQQQYNNYQQQASSSSPMSSSSSASPSPPTPGKSGGTNASGTGTHTASGRKSKHTATKRKRTTTTSSNGSSGKRHKNDSNNNTNHHHHHNDNQQQLIYPHSESSRDIDNMPLKIKPEIEHFTTGPFNPSSPEGARLNSNIDLELLLSEDNMMGYGAMMIDSNALLDDNPTIFNDPNLHPASEQTKLPTFSPYSGMSHQSDQSQHQQNQNPTLSNHQLQQTATHSHQQLHQQLLHTSVPSNHNHSHQQLHQHQLQHHQNGNDTTLQTQQTVTMNLNVAKVERSYYANPSASVTDDSDCSILTSDAASPQIVYCNSIRSGDRSLNSSISNSCNLLESDYVMGDLDMGFLGMEDFQSSGSHLEFSCDRI